MKLIIHGQQAFGKAVLESLLERGEDVLPAMDVVAAGQHEPTRHQAGNALDACCARWAAKQKLQNMVEGVKLVRKEVSAA